MGVDYDATFGIGVKVHEPDFETPEMEDLGIDDMCEWLEHITENTNFEYGEMGCGSYSGRPNDYYIFIKDPLKEGIDKLQDKADELMLFLKEKDISFEGEIDLIGGIHMW
jgi:hypothetical protein